MKHLSPLPPSSVIGIIGGGQLGRMICRSAAQLGYQTHIFAPDADCPAAQLANFCTVGSTTDRALLIQFARQVDVITFEFENVDIDNVRHIETLCPIYPRPDIVAITRDRAKEKQFLNDINISTAPWMLLPPHGEMLQELSFPAIVKTTRDGYDGKGQMTVHNKEHIQDAINTLKPAPLIMEQRIDFTCELSVMVVGSIDGKYTCFDTTENHHTNGILDVSLAPAPRSLDVRRKAQEMAVHIAHALKLVGLMGVEFFLDETGTLRVNELAPRPHNSGHWTMDGCFYDQFDMLVRAIARLPIPQPIRCHDVIMKNLIGPKSFKQFQKALSHQGFIPYLYGKKTARKGRKMGHVNIPLPYDSLPGTLAIESLLEVFDV